MNREHNIVQVHRFKAVFKNEPDGFSAIALASIFRLADKQTDKGIPMQVVDILQANAANQGIALKKHNGVAVYVTVWFQQPF